LVGPPGFESGTHLFIWHYLQLSAYKSTLLEPDSLPAFALNLWGGSTLAARWLHGAMEIGWKLPV
jgi:hypothetical protein